MHMYPEDKKVGAVVEVNAEIDFCLQKNAEFQKFVEDMLQW